MQVCSLQARFPPKRWPLPQRFPLRTPWGVRAQCRTLRLISCVPTHTLPVRITAGVPCADAASCVRVSTRGPTLRFCTRSRLAAAPRTCSCARRAPLLPPCALFSSSNLTALNVRVSAELIVRPGPRVCGPSCAWPLRATRAHLRHALRPAPPHPLTPSSRAPPCINGSSPSSVRPLDSPSELPGQPPGAPAGAPGRPWCRPPQATLAMCV